MSRSKPLPAPQRNTALCYIRKSYTRDEKDMISPERQRDHCQRVCDDNGWIPEWHEDTEGHKSGMHEKNRPGWLAVKARLSDSDVVALVANDLARLHRKGWRVGDLLDFLDQTGIRLVLADPRRHMDFSTIQGRLIAQLSAIFDEWYAKDVSERWKADIAHRKSKGITVGIPPFGTVRHKETKLLIPTNKGAWLLPDGNWIAGETGEQPPTEGAIWRGYYQCAERVLRLYAEERKSRGRVCEIMQKEGWAFRDRDGNPTWLKPDAVRRITNNWIEYGGVVFDTRAKKRRAYADNLDTVQLNLERAVFDVELLYLVGKVQKERSIRPPDRGHALNDYPYPLASITYCSHCLKRAKEKGDPSLMSTLGGKRQSRYRHKSGYQCGCSRKSVQRETLEGDFLRLINLLEIKPDKLDLLTQLALSMRELDTQDEQALEAQRTAAIAKCQRKIDAARHLYEDGDLSRDEYLRRKDANEREIAHWKSYTTESEQLAVQLSLCIEAVEKLSRVWELGNDEDRQGMARNLFDFIVYDLDKQQIVDFQLKAWAEQFLTLRASLYADGGELQATANGVGTNALKSPDGVT